MRVLWDRWGLFALAVFIGSAVAQSLTDALMLGAVSSFGVYILTGVIAGVCSSLIRDAIETARREIGE